MGWWSPTIMGGDAPLDSECEILAFLGVDDVFEADDIAWDQDEAHARMAAAVKSKTPRDWLNFLTEEDKEITAQVTALMIMQLGLPLHHEIAQMAIRACRNEDVSGWGSDAGERRAHLDQLVRAIELYDGTPQDLPHEDLFDVIFAELGPHSTMH